MRLRDAFTTPGEVEWAVMNDGERYVPLTKLYSAAMHLGHMASYREALRYSYGRRVLDIGCGVGYGACLLASYGASHVVGVDVGADALAYAREVYRHPHLEYVQASALDLPFGGASFDFVFSSQVIEHVADPERFLRGIDRVLAPDGFCLVITPNHDLFSPSGDTVNPHHASEMNLPAYQLLAGSVFPHVQFRGIPQNCLELPPGQSAPVLKPDSRLRPEDYRVRDDEIDRCENLLCFGHKRPDGAFSASLPAKLAPVTDELAPFFWDSGVARWVVMDACPTALVPSRWDGTDVGLIRALRPNLYRIELDLHTQPPSPATFCLYRWPRRAGNPVAEGRLVGAGSRLDLSFDPQPDSEGQTYAVVARLYPAGASPILRLVQRFTAKSEPITASVRTFYDCLPAPYA